MTETKTYFKEYWITYFLIFAAIAALYPFFPLLLQAKGLSPSKVGFLMGSYDLFSIIGLMTIGHFYDRVNSPGTVLLTIGSICIVVLFFLSGSTSLIALILLTITMGFFVKSATSLIDARYGQTIKNPEKSYGKARLAGSIGFLLASLIIHFTHIVQGSRPRSVFFGYSIFLAAALIASLFLPTQFIEQKEKSSESRGFLKTIRTFPPIYWIGLSIAFLSSLSMSGHYTFFSLLLKNNFHTEDISGFWAIGPLFEIPLFFFSGFLFIKFKLRTLWLFSLIAGIIRMLVYSLAETVLPLYLVQVFHSLSFGLNHLCMINLITKHTSSESRGLAMSIYTAIGMGFSMFTGGIIGGLILQKGDFSLLFLIFSLFPLIAIIISFIFLKEDR